MIALQDAAMLARQYVERHLDRADLRLVLQEEYTTEYSFGWIFFYNSQEFVRTGNVAYLVGGNAPLLVERETGRLFVTGTAHPIQTYIDRYLETGDPHGEVSRRVAFDRETSCPNKLPTIQALRDLAPLGIVEAKALVDESLAGKTVIIEAPDAEAAGQLIARLDALGWRARRHYDRDAAHTVVEAG
jgi:hypothetical protein